MSDVHDDYVAGDINQAIRALVGAAGVRDGVTTSVDIVD
jgi:predicted RNA-binding protein YlqC (UPF0109 family)